MGRRWERPWTRAVISAVALGALAALPGCGASSPAGAPRPAPAHSTASRAPGTPRATVTTPRAATGIAVSGDHPVLPSGSQDTNAQAAGASCDRADVRRRPGHRGQGGDRVRGRGLSRLGRPADPFPARHRHRGRLPGGIGDLEAGAGQPRLPDGGQPGPGRDPRPAEGGPDPHPALGRAVAGGGLRVRRQRSVLGLPRYPGPDRDRKHPPGARAVHRHPHLRHPGQLRVPGRRHAGRFGPPMRYLQTVCGAPQHPGGAHWFPDTITVTVAFR